MKIAKMQDIDLSKYRIAFYKGDSMSHSALCQDDVMALVEGGGDPVWEIGELSIALIPKENKLTECGGDDWNDTPASHNASGFYRYPAEGTIFLKGKLGGELKLVDDL